MGVKSMEKYGNSQLDLTELGVALAKIFEEQQRPLLVFDSFTTLINRHGADSGQAFLHSLVAKTKAYKANSIIILNHRAFPESVFASVSDIAEGVIELKAAEKQGAIHYVMRVSKMTGVEHETTWIQYMPHHERGIEQA